MEVSPGERAAGALSPAKLEALAAEFRRDGVVVLRSVIPDDELALLRPRPRACVPVRGALWRRFLAVLWPGGQAGPNPQRWDHWFRTRQRPQRPDILYIGLGKELGAGSGPIAHATAQHIPRGSAFAL